MTSDAITTFRDAITSAGITRYTVIIDNNLIIDIDSESTRAIWDDGNELLYFFRVPNGVQPKDNRQLSLNMVCYDDIQCMRVAAPTMDTKAIADALGLELTDDITTWIKKETSQTGLYPAASNPPVDKDGNKVLYSGRPTIR